jgi:mRNA interferase RelE/StbE
MRRSGAAPSSEFRVFETEEFRKALARLHAPASVTKKLGSYVYPQLRVNPYFGPNIRKLRAYTPPTWRYRIGSYRLFYAIDAEVRIVFLLTVDDRKDAYR